MFNPFKNFIGRRRDAALGNEQGQSLVEMAVIVPLLLFIFLGLIEVGWAIRGYLVLLTTGRETARFASRGEYLDFSDIVEVPFTEDTDAIKRKVQYSAVLTHAGEVLSSNRLGLDLDLDPVAPIDPNGSMILSHFLIDTGFPCEVDPSDPNPYCPANCYNPDTREFNPDNLYTADDLILFPGRPGYDHYQYTAGLTSTYTTRRDPTIWVFGDANIPGLVFENNELNCQALKRNPRSSLSVNSTILVESFYPQDQILGFPLISNALTDPILLYNHTLMRITPVEGKSQGEACELSPLALDLGDLLAASVPDPSNTEELDVPILLETIGFQWVRWKDGQSNGAAITRTVSVDTSSADYFAYALSNKRLSLNEYENPDDPSDKVINAGNRLSLVGSPTGSTALLTKELDENKNRILSVPVFNGGTTVSAFARIQLRTHDIINKTITAEFIEWDRACPIENVTYLYPPF